MELERGREAERTFCGQNREKYLAFKILSLYFSQLPWLPVTSKSQFVCSEEGIALLDCPMQLDCPLQLDCPEQGFKLGLPHTVLLPHAVGLPQTGIAPCSWIAPNMV